MVSLKLYAIVSMAFFATLAFSQSVAPAKPQLIQVKVNLCKHVRVDDNSEKQVKVIRVFSKSKNGKDFVSTVEYDKQTVVHYEKGKAAMVTKSGYESAPQVIRFKYSYDHGEETAYIKTNIYETCKVEGSDQWPGLDEVAYVKLPHVLV